MSVVLGVAVSQSAYALRQRRRVNLTRGIAVGLVILLVAAIAAAAVDLAASDEKRPSVTTPRSEPVEPGTAKPDQILAPSTASPQLDAAIAGLISDERFRFELKMKPIAARGDTSWRVVGEADLATASDDPPRLHAQVAIGSGDAYSVISEQIRVGDALFNRDAKTGSYVPGEPSGDEQLGAVDPVTSILSSLIELPASSFTEVPSKFGTRTIMVRAAGHEIEADITTMRIVLDEDTNRLRSMFFRSSEMTSRVVVSDLADPSIDIRLP